jgi:hypothetical protein
MALSAARIDPADDMDSDDDRLLNPRVSDDRPIGYAFASLFACVEHSFVPNALGLVPFESIPGPTSVRGTSKYKTVCIIADSEDIPDTERSTDVEKFVDQLLLFEDAKCNVCIIRPTRARSAHMPKNLDDIRFGATPVLRLKTDRQSVPRDEYNQETRRLLARFHATGRL